MNELVLHTDVDKVDHWLFFIAFQLQSAMDLDLQMNGDTMYEQLKKLFQVCYVQCLMNYINYAANWA